MATVKQCLMSRASPVEKALCTVPEMKEGPWGSVKSSPIPSHRELLRSKAVVMSVAEGRDDPTRQVKSVTGLRSET